MYQFLSEIMTELPSWNAISISISAGRNIMIANMLWHGQKFESLTEEGEPISDGYIKF